MTSLFYITGGGRKQRRYYQIKKNKKRSNKKRSNKKRSNKKRSNKKRSNDEKNNNYQGEVKRISCQEYDDQTKNKNLGKTKPRIGSKVIIILKPYHNYDCKIGIVSRVLTNKQIHTRGHKVMLENGLIGRTLKIINL